MTDPAHVIARLPRTAADASKSDAGPTSMKAATSPVEKAPSVLDERWVTFSEANLHLLQDEPPPQKWLLKQPYRGRDVGVFPRGRTGLLTATGGVGKTYSLIDLAVAVATGGFWFSTFRVVEPGHVLLALAEEDLDEARRRIWRVCNAREFSRDERAAIGERLDILPLAGASVALTHSPAPGVIGSTPLAHDLKERLEKRGVEWSLLIFDPLSRWAGGGVEGDNEAATRFCQVVEALGKVPGDPSTLLAHHSSKTSAKDGMADARGVTGIRDGFRWQVSLDPIKAEDGTHGVRMSNRKSNYSRIFDEVFLVRSEEPGCEGTLRRATEQECAALGGGADLDSEDYAARVIETVSKCPGLRSLNDVAKRTKGKRTALSDALKTLIRDGQIVQGASGFEVVPGFEEEK